MKGAKACLVLGGNGFPFKPQAILWIYLSALLYLTCANVKLSLETRYISLLQTDLSAIAPRPPFISTFPKTTMTFLKYAGTRAFLSSRTSRAIELELTNRSLQRPRRYCPHHGRSRRRLRNAILAHCRTREAQLAAR